MTWVQIVCGGCLWWGLVATGCAASPLSDYVAADVALFAEISELDRDWSETVASKFGQRWSQSSLRALMLASPGGRRWETVNQRVAAATDRTLVQHLRGLFAQSVAVALTIPEQGEPQAMLLARGRSAVEMQGSLDDWNRLEPMVVLAEKSIEGQGYFERRAGAKPGTVHFYALIGDLFLFSDRETLVVEAIQRLKNQRPSPSTAALTTSTLYQQASAAPREAGTLQIFLNPRRWDRLLEQSSDQTAGALAFLKSWQTTIVAHGRIVVNDQGCRAMATVEFAPESLTENWQQSVTAAQRPGGQLFQVPGDALFVIGGKLEAGSLLAGFRRLLSPGDRQKWDRVKEIFQGLLLGSDPWQETAAALLQDWAGYVVARPEVAKNRHRLHPFVAVWQTRLTNTEDTNTQESVTQLPGLENAISFGMNLLQVLANSTEQGPRLSLTRSHRVEPPRWEWLLSGRPEADLAVRLSPTLLQLSSTAMDSATPDFPATGVSETPWMLRSRLEFPQPNLLVWCPLENWMQPVAGTEVTPRAWMAGLFPRGEQVLAPLVDLFAHAYLSVSCRPSALQLNAGFLAPTPPHSSPNASSNALPGASSKAANESATRGLAP